MILDEIIAARRIDVERARRETPAARLRQSLLYDEPRRGFAAALRATPPAIIAEVKKASPSRGVIRADFDPVHIACAYEAGGAAAISVLTEERHFQGSLEHLKAIRRAVRLPLLRKDFTVDPYQIIEARAGGADAVLLIVAALEDGELRELLSLSAECGLDALTEVHTENELQRALAAGATLIGVNNRDLRTFVTRLEVAERLRPLIPSSAVAIAESGIDSVADITRLCAAGYHAFLIGESLMRAPDPGAKLRQILASRVPR